MAEMEEPLEAVDMRTVDAAMSRPAGELLVKLTYRGSMDGGTVHVMPTSRSSLTYQRMADGYLAFKYRFEAVDEQRRQYVVTVYDRNPGEVRTDFTPVATVVVMPPAPTTSRVRQSVSELD